MEALHANSERKELLTARINQRIAAIEQKAESLVRAHSQPALPQTPRSPPVKETPLADKHSPPTTPLQYISKSLANSRQEQVPLKLTSPQPVATRHTPARRPKPPQIKRPKNWLGKENLPIMDLPRLRETILNRIFL